VALVSGLRASRLPPTARRHERPDSFYETKRPRTLKKAVNRPKDARTGKCQNKPRTTSFDCIKQHHERYRHKPEYRQAVQSGSPFYARQQPNRRPRFARQSRCDVMTTHGRGDSSLRKTPISGIEIGASRSEIERRLVFEFPHKQGTSLVQKYAIGRSGEPEPF
jgi:hypothetical protein